MPKTSTERMWAGAAVVIALIVALLGYLLFIGPQRDSTSSVENDTATAQTQNATLQVRINALDAQNKKLSVYKTALQKAQLALPSSSGLPAFLRTLKSLGDSTLADITSLTIGAPAVVGADAASSTSTGTNADATSDSSTTKVDAPTTPSGPTVYQLPITAELSGTIPQLTAFLGQLQSVQPRAVLIGSITLGDQSGAASAGKTTMSITLNAFVAPGSVAETTQLAQAAGQ